MRRQGFHFPLSLVKLTAHTLDCFKELSQTYVSMYPGQTSLQRAVSRREVRKAGVYWVGFVNRHSQAFEDTDFRETHFRPRGPTSRNTTGRSYGPMRKKKKKNKLKNFNKFLEKNNHQKNNSGQ